MELLYLAHRAPYPPDRGDRLRSYHCVEALARLGPVDVVAQADSPQDAARAREGLAPLCREVHVFARSSLWATWRMGLALLGTGSLTLARHRDRRVAAAIRGASLRHDYDLAMAFSSGTGPWWRAARARHKLMDLCDLDALKWSALGGDGSGLLSRLRRLEGRRLLSVELGLARDAELCLVSTRREAEDVRARIAPRHLEVLTQGASWRRLQGLPEPSRVGPVLGFLGQMDYPPNVRAASFLAHSVLPIVRESIEDARLRIMGRAPNAAVRSLARLPGVEITGEVSSVGDALGTLAIFCAPIDRGRGIPTKLVEAMAAGRAVLLSEWAAGALSGQPGRDYLVAEGGAALARTALELLRSPERLDAVAAAGCRYVRKWHDWSRLQDRLVQLATELAHA